jgi:hypothetical protein
MPRVCEQRRLVLSVNTRMQVKEMLLFRDLASLGGDKRTPFGATTLFIIYGTTSVSIVGGSSSTIDVGSPAEKIMFPR